MDKILFFDIDGTLGQHGVITESNLKALHLLKEKGYKTFMVILLVELLVVMDVIFFMKERSFIVELLLRNN